MLQMRFSLTFIIVFLFIYSTFPRSYTLRRRLHFHGVICMKIPTHVYNALLGSLFVLNGVASFVIGWKISRHFVDQSAGRTSGDLRTFPALEPTVCSCIQIWLVYSFVWAYRHWPGLAWCHSNEDFWQCFFCSRSKPELPADLNVWRNTTSSSGDYFLPIKICLK